MRLAGVDAADQPSASALISIESPQGIAAPRTLTAQIWPGSGWYMEILAASLREQGHG